MRRIPILLSTLAICASLQAQTTTYTFECYTPGPFPADPALGCEGIAGNNLVTFPNTSGISSTPVCGFPTNGLNYALLICSGPVSTVPNGGPFPWPPSANVSQLRIPIPIGATAVAIDWEYHNAESLGSSFNDGMAVCVVDPAGVLVQQLIYADNQIPFGTCAGNGTEIAPPGPQNTLAVLPPLATGCEYLAIICWNEGDNAVSGATRIDNVVFNSGLPGCTVPCFTGMPTVGFASPFGPGSIQINMGGLTSNGTYFLAVALVAGAYPNGWFFGLDITLQELFNLLSFGYPFIGAVNNCGGASVGPFGGVPSGLPVYAVALGAIGPGLGTVTVISQPASYIIP